MVYKYLLPLVYLFRLSQTVLAQKWSKPTRGYSTWTQQVYVSTHDGINYAKVITSSLITSQASILSNLSTYNSDSSSLHTFNLDSGWSNGIDQYGRHVLRSDIWPEGVESLSGYLKAQGLALGLYYIPGVPNEAVKHKYPVFGTNYTSNEIILYPSLPLNSAKRPPANAFFSQLPLNFSHPGAAAYLSSVITQLYEWNISHVKLDGCYPGSNIAYPLPANSSMAGLDTRPEEKMWREFIDELAPPNKPPIWFATSWERPREIVDDLRGVSDTWRITIDIESYDGQTLTTFSRVMRQACKLAGWTSISDRFLESDVRGWLDMDSLPVGGPGLKDNEFETMFTLWTLSGGPILLGGNLTNLSPTEISLLSNQAALDVQYRSAATGVGPAKLLGYQDGVLTCNALDGKLVEKDPTRSVGKSGKKARTFGQDRKQNKSKKELIMGVDSAQDDLTASELLSSGGHTPLVLIDNQEKADVKATSSASRPTDLPDWFQHQVWHFEEADGTVVVGVINAAAYLNTRSNLGLQMMSTSANISFTIPSLYAHSGSAIPVGPQSYQVTDIYSGQQLGSIQANQTWVSLVPAQSSFLLEFKPVAA